MLAATAPDAVARFEAEVRASTSATAVLQRHCPGATIRAVIVPTGPVAATAVQRRRLAVGRAEPVVYRRVRLMCGAVELSAAENWYVPSRLTPAMRRALAGSTPFGTVIRPLKPVRRIVSVERLGDDPVLRMVAVVVAGDGQPLAEVVETYRRASISAD